MEDTGAGGVHHDHRLPPDTCLHAFPAERRPLPEYFSSGWLGVHTTLAFLADASFAIAFCIAMMYIIQERQLKHKNPGGFYRRLPPLDVLDELSYRSIVIGFPLLTLAMITGAIWADSAWGTYWGWEPKEIWSLITWLIYASYLHARLVAGWRGRKAAYLAVIGFLIVLFTFLGVNCSFQGDTRLNNMEIVVVGISHKTASVEIRDAFFPGSEAAGRAGEDGASRA